MDLQGEDRKALLKTHGALVLEVRRPGRRPRVCRTQGSRFAALGLPQKARDLEKLSLAQATLILFPLEQEMRFQRLRDLLPSHSVGISVLQGDERRKKGMVPLLY